MLFYVKSSEIYFFVAVPVPQCQCQCLYCGSGQCQCQRQCQCHSATACHSRVHLSHEDATPPPPAAPPATACRLPGRCWTAPKLHTSGRGSFFIAVITSS